MMLHVALVLLCAAQLIHFSRYWWAMNREMYATYQEARLTRHLDWTKPRRGPRVASAPRRG